LQSRVPSLTAENLSSYIVFTNTKLKFKIVKKKYSKMHIDAQHVRLF